MKDKQRDTGLNGYPCGAGNAMDDWLSIPSVQEALHVKVNTNGFSYVKTAGNLLPLYSTLVKKVDCGSMLMRIAHRHYSTACSSMLVRPSVAYSRRIIILINHR